MPPQDPQSNQTVNSGDHPSTSTASPTSVPPTTPQPAFITPATGDPSQPKATITRSWLKLLLILLAVAVVVAIVIFTLFNGQSSNKTTEPTKTAIENMTVKVPSTWKRIDSKFGFSIFAPAGWSAGTTASSDINGLSSKSVSVSATGGDFNVGVTTQDQIDQSVNVGVQKLDKGNSESAFDNKVSQLSSSDKALINALGADTSKFTVKPRSLKINGRHWLEVTTALPSQYSDNLYYWDKDHAIALTVENPSHAKVKQLSQTYLFPMAASLNTK